MADAGDERDPAPAAAGAGGAGANDDGGGGLDEGGGEPLPQLPPVLAIADLEHYIRSRALGGPPDRDDEDRMDREILAREAADQTDEARRYQHEVHRRIFGEDEAGGGGGGDAAGAAVRDGRRCGGIGDEYRGATVAIRTADGAESTAPLLPLSESCDFVRGMARFASSSSYAPSPPSSPPPSPTADGGGGGGGGGGGDGSPPTSPAKKRARKPLVLSLEEFDSAAVREFLPAALGERGAGDVPARHAVECCRIAHYLQCPAVLDGVVTLLIESVDSENCLSLCHLADALDLPPLYERAVDHMLTSLDDMEGHELWEEMPKALRVRVMTMRNAVRSSLLARGTKTGVFFSCGEEFLAILSDNLREQRERLDEAKRRQGEVVRDRMECDGGRPGGDGNGLDFSIDGDLVGAGAQMWNSVRDAQEKIERQERRIETLESFYREQKAIFEGAGWLREKKEGGFVL